jgi:hypothetical protein
MSIDTEIEDKLKFSLFYSLRKETMGHIIMNKKLKEVEDIEHYLIGILKSQILPHATSTIDNYNNALKRLVLLGFSERANQFQLHKADMNFITFKKVLFIAGNLGYNEYALLEDSAIFSNYAYLDEVGVLYLKTLIFRKGTCSGVWLLGTTIDNTVYYNTDYSCIQDGEWLRIEGN